VILPDTAFKYLYDEYGGIDCPRESIEVEAEEDSDEEGKDKKREFIIEIFYKKL